MRVAVSTLTAPATRKASTSLPPYTMKYRIHCAIWHIEAASAYEAKKTACDLLRRMPEKFIAAEEFSILNKKHGLLRYFLLGR